MASKVSHKFFRSKCNKHRSKPQSSLPNHVNELSNQTVDSDVFDKKSFMLKNVELLRTVGTGTFGRVVVVRDKTAHQYYALKILIIEEIMKLKQADHVKQEKAILQQVNHPFIVKLYWTNHDVKFLYMLFEYICGGELFTYLRNIGTFPVSTARFYSAEIALALSYLHNLNILYRDLKPENLLLDAQGHIKLTDFGFSKVVKDRTYTLCGTPEYLAPEIIQAKGYNRAVDWWALGVFIYEVLYGVPPFFDENPICVYEKIVNNRYEFPKEPDYPVANDLIKRFLSQDRTKRLGTMKGGAQDVFQHEWFDGIDWNEFLSRKIRAPIIPKVKHEGDTRCYDKYPEEDYKSVPYATPVGQAMFSNF